MHSSLAAAIRRQVSILDVVQQYVQLTQSGTEYKGLSPFTQEKTPSFFVSPEKGVYYCFSTKTGGDVISFVMEAEKLDFKEAVQFLAKKYRIQTSEKEKNEYDTYNSYITLHKRLSKTLQYLLYHHPESEKARAYLHNRGITEASIQLFEIGYAPRDPQWMVGFLKAKGYSEDFLKKAGIIGRYKGAFFRHRIMFPLINQQHEYLGFGGRLLGDRGPKYLHSPETIVFKKKRFYYGLNHAVEAIKTTKKVYLVEGYFDVIACHQAGITNVIAPLGTALGREALQLLLVYTDTIVLLFDADEAGLRAAIRVANIAIELEITIRGVLMPENVDPAELVQTQGSDAFRKILDQEGDIFVLILAYTVKKFNNNMGAIYSNIFPFISQLQSEVKQSECLVKFADYIHRKQEDVEYDYRQYLYNKKIPSQLKKQQGHIRQQISAELVLAATNWHYFSRLREDVNVDDYEREGDKKLFYIMEDVFRTIEKNTHEFSTLVQAAIDDEGIKQRILESIFHASDFALGMKIIEDSIQQKQKKRFKRRRRSLIEDYDIETEHVIADEITMLNKKVDNITQNK